MSEKTCDHCINWTIIPDCTTWGECSRNKEYLMAYNDFCSKWKSKNKKVDPGSYKANWNKIRAWMEGGTFYHGNETPKWIIGKICHKMDELESQESKSVCCKGEIDPTTYPDPIDLPGGNQVPTDPDCYLLYEQIAKRVNTMEMCGTCDDISRLFDDMYQIKKVIEDFTKRFDEMDKFKQIISELCSATFNTLNSRADNFERLYYSTNTKFEGLETVVDEIGDKVLYLIDENKHVNERINEVIKDINSIPETIYKRRTENGL